jgi:thiamine kinase-like enzyme
MLDFQKYFKEKIEYTRKLNHRGNNQLFEIKFSEKRYLLKLYSEKHMDNWKRGKSEFNAISYLWERGFREIPQPIAFYVDENIAIYSYELGKILRSEEVNEENIVKATDFLFKLHCLSVEEKKLFGPASSACLFLSEYFNVLDRRFANISTFSPDSPILKMASELIQNKVYPIIQDLKNNFSLSCKGIPDELSLEAQVLTPADFGFHNILVSPDRYTFVDFEYFGRDDPVRQILDFLHHDKSIGIKKEMKDLFIKTYHEHTKPNDGFEERLKFLDPLIGMTWVLIYLNVLSKDYLEHIKFAQGSIEGVVEERIMKAEKKLNDLFFFK